jgi:beta-glucosidase
MEMAKKPKPKKAPTKRGSVAMGIVAGVCVVLAVVLNVGTSMMSSLLDHYLGGRPYTVETVEGSDSWDTEYYTSDYRGRTQATSDAKDLTAEVEGEGIVMLKNDGDALPIDSGTTVSLLGRYAADPIYGGAGSGTVDPDDCTDLYAGLTEAGLTVNDTAYDWIKQNYSNYAKADITMDDPSTASYYIGEIPWSDYSSEAQDSIKGTTAVVVIGRGGGEGGDLSTNLLDDLDSGVSTNFTANSETANYVEGQHELELTVEEKSLIAAAKRSCSKVVVLVNASTTMELGPLMEKGGDYEVDAILEIGSLGASGAKAVGNVLTGATNPSGRTTDIWAADFTADPTFGNFGGNQYTDVSGYYTTNYNSTKSDGTAYFVEYEEGIYYGYRYYETAAVEAAAGNYAGFDYDSSVVFPFGYGLSYTDFTQTLDDVTQDGTTVTAKVTVTNTGSVAGKSVAEIYYTAPYTSGGVEKSAVVLGAFDKTKLLEAGESQTLTLTYDVRDMASWDSSAKNGGGAYVLDAGDYVVSLRSDSHTVIDSRTLTLDAKTYDTDSSTGNSVSNEFSDLTTYMDDNCENLSRADFSGTWPKAAADKTAESVGISFAEYDVAANEDSSATMPTTGASNGLSLIDLRGADYDDEAWDSLLDELSVSDMTSVLNDGAYNTAELASISKPATSDPDGPAGFTSLTGPTGNCSYCSEYVMAQTWNTDLMNQVGEMVGQEALASGYSGWYAPAANTHRSPFGGRNFEYYSEDPLLSGKMCSAVVSGAASNGCYAYVKHFAMNDQESYRVQHICVWANEQTAREIYLKPFEITVKESTYEEKYISDDNGTVSTKTMPACSAIMSSFNYIGATWAGGRESLMTDVLRNEWGFTGMAITDFNLYGYMNKNQAVAAGTDLQLTYSAMTGNYQATDSATVVSQMRESMHRLLYTVVNSNAMNGMSPGSTVKYGVANWQWAVYGVTAVLAAIAALMVFGVFKRRKRRLAMTTGAVGGTDPTDPTDPAPAAPLDPTPDASADAPHDAADPHDVT